MLYEKRVKMEHFTKKKFWAAMHRFFAMDIWNIQGRSKVSCPPSILLCTLQHNDRSLLNMILCLFFVVLSKITGHSQRVPLLPVYSHSCNWTFCSPGILPFLHSWDSWTYTVLKKPLCSNWRWFGKQRSNFHT